MSLIQKWPLSLRMTCDLAGILQKWQNVGGCDQVFDKVYLSDCLSADLALEWGALANLGRNSSVADIYGISSAFSLPLWLLAMVLT